MPTDALLGLLTTAVADALHDLQDAADARRDYLAGAEDLEDTAIPAEVEAVIAPGTPAMRWAEGRGSDANRDAK